MDMGMEPHFRVSVSRSVPTGQTIDTKKSLLREWFKITIDAEDFFLFGHAPVIETTDPGPEAAYALEQAKYPSLKGDYRLNLPDPDVSGPPLQDMNLSTRTNRVPTRI